MRLFSEGGSAGATRPVENVMQKMRDLHVQFGNCRTPADRLSPSSRTLEIESVTAPKHPAEVLISRVDAHQHQLAFSMLIRVHS
jgi:hypothetical protein